MSGAFFPYGGQYYRTPNPPEADWERDLRQMRAQGMNTVRLWAMWSWIHQENDTFDFSHLDRLTDICRQIGLKALIQVILENAPAWLMNRHPEARYMANDGQQIQPMGRPNTPGGGWPGLCLDNPPARQAAEAFMIALARHFAGHEAILGYDVWNEVWFELDGYIGNQYYCYCPETVREFKDYLQKKYHDLAGLNRGWYRRYSSWDEVVPPRYWGGYPDWIDWIQFRLANQGRLLKWRVGTLRAADPKALLVSHGLPTTLGSMATHLTDDWRNAGEVDIYGLSCFPLWFGYDRAETFRVHDMIRGASGKKTFWTAEMQAGPSGEGLMHSPTPTPQDVRLWNWIGLACGAKGVLYWQWRPELLGPESPGFGLCDLDGSPTERTRVASQFASLTNKHPELKASVPMRGELAIAVIPESQIFCHVADRNAGKYAQAVRGAYRAFSQAGYQVDFARVDELEGYPLVYLPFPLMLEEHSARRLADYVQNGGTLISEACPAQFGDAGFVQVTTPGYGLHEVFGVQARSGPDTVRDYPPTIQWNGSAIACAIHRQRLIPAKADVLAEYSDGGPAITCHRYGQGTAILIGTYPGISLEFGSQEAGRFLTELASQAGFSPRAQADCPDLWIRLHTCDTSLIVFIVNASREARKATVALSPNAALLQEGTDLVTGEPVATADNRFIVTVDAEDARLIRFDRVFAEAAQAESKSDTFRKERSER